MRIAWLLLAFPAILAAYNWGYDYAGFSGAVPTPAPGCHQSYSGVCLAPYGGDYDCIGGSGNGPFFTGKVYVVGPDIFALDGDRDGIGCG